MERIHYEVAVLAHYEVQEPGLRGENDPLMNQAIAMPQKENVGIEPPSVGIEPKLDLQSNLDKEQEWFNPMEYLLHTDAKECTSGDLTDYISAEDFANFLDPTPIEEVENAHVESTKDFIGKEKAFMGKLTDKLSNIDQNNREVVNKCDVDSNAESDVDSEAYFSASSQPLEDGFPRPGQLSTSTSAENSRSSSVGYSSRSSSISRSRITEDQSSDEDVNFGDVDTISLFSMPFSHRRKKQLRMRKGNQQLGTIYSPGYKHGNMVVTKGLTGKESESESIELTSAFYTCQSSCGPSDSESVFITSQAESSSGTATESSLNPLCSPFVPRAMNTSFNYTTQTDSDCPLEKHAPGTLVDDSGFGTCNNKTVDLSPLGNQNIPVDKNATSEPNSMDVIDGDMLVSSEQIKTLEFDCKIQHSDDEFFSLKDFSISKIPTDYQNTSSWETITTMSHRVVRIRVTKTSTVVNSEQSERSLSQSMNPDDKCIHFGSGFAHYVDKDFVEIRTHSKVVSTAEDVENAVVTFSLTSSNGGYVNIDLTGERTSLHFNKYDHSSVFRCKSKGKMDEYLGLFVDVPILRQTSSFQDSDYFSEESSSCSSVHSTKRENFLNNPEDLCCEETVLSVIGSLGIIEDIKIGEISRNNAKCNFKDELETYENLISATDPTNTLNMLESNSNSFQYNLSRLNELQNFVPTSESNSRSPSRFPSLSIPVPALEQIAKEEVPSPLRVMEKRKSKINPGVCPYTKQSPDFVAEYKPFSSFAGDVIQESLPSFPSLPTLSPYADFPEWEMAGLLLAQTHQREQYEQKYNLQKAESRTEAQPSVDGSSSFHDLLRNVTLNSYPDFSTESLLDSWDKDLINLDANLQPLPPYRYFEDLLDYHDQGTGQCRCAQSGKTADRAVLISYPHGGEKVVSFGHFSAHRHVGGELYDTPSCAGSCGAPVLAVRQGGVSYVSNIIHAGCCLVNGVNCGIGQAHLDDGKCINNQLSDICN